MIRELFIYELHKAGMSINCIRKILELSGIPEILTRISSKPIGDRHALETIFA
jgi:hypothetical protein